jgi:hypothetical protein
VYGEDPDDDTVVVVGDAVGAGVEDRGAGVGEDAVPEGSDGLTGIVWPELSAGGSMEPECVPPPQAAKTTVATTNNSDRTNSRLLFSIKLPTCIRAEGTCYRKATLQGRGPKENRVASELFRGLLKAYELLVSLVAVLVAALCWFFKRVRAPLLMRSRPR